MTYILKRDSIEVRAATERSYRPMRIKTARPIAQAMARETLKRFERLEKDLFGEMVSIADSRGESPPSYTATVRADRKENPVKTKAFSEVDILEIMAAISGILTVSQIESIQSLFRGAADDIGDIFNRYLREGYQDGLNYAYDRMKRFARPQDAVRFAQVAKTYALNPDSSFMRGFLEGALNRVTAKLTREFQTEAFLRIFDGISNGDTWKTIARSIHKKVGMGARWQWTRLVRTELMSAYHNSARERHTDAGIEYERLSVASTACPICVGAKGIYKLGEGPTIPLHPNCRCSNIPYYRLPRGSSVRDAYVITES